MKEYFSHDYNATLDPKIIALLGDYGAIGYGIYWRIVEMLHAEESHTLPLKEYIYKALAKQMSTSVEQISTIINDCINVYELFIKDNDFFYCQRVLDNIEVRTKISESRSKAGKISAERRKNATNVEQSLTSVQQNLTSVQQNSTKFNKEKEIKEKEIKENNNKEEIKKEEIKKEEKKKFSFDFSNFDENFIEHVNSWLEYKKERKEPYKSQKGLNAFYNKLIDYSKNDPDTAKKIIEQSMANNWAGIFELKESQQKNKDPFYREPIIDRTHGFSIQF